MSEGGIVCLLMGLNVDAYAGVVLERCLRANGGHVGVNESVLAVVGQV